METREQHHPGSPAWGHAPGRLLTSLLASLLVGFLAACGGGGGGGAQPAPSPAAVAPAITSQPTSRTVAIGERAVFTVAATGTSLSYQWQKNGVDVAGATADWYTTDPAQTGDSGTRFTVLVKNTASALTSSAATLIVSPAPVAASITTQPSSQTVTVGDRAVFTVAATGTSLSYQWQKNGVDVAGATTDWYATDPAQAGDSGTMYTVIVKNTVNTLTSSAATLTVSPAPVAPSITTQPSHQAVTAGERAVFTVAAAGTSLHYQWKRRVGASTWTNVGGDSSWFAIDPAMAGDSGSTYTVTVSNSVGSLTSDPATLTVNALPLIRSFSATQGPIPIGGGGVLTWEVSGADALVVDQGVGGLHDASGTLNVMPSATTTYTLKAFNAAGFTSSTATLTVDATAFQFTAFTASPLVVPFGGNATLNWSYAGLPLELRLDGAPVSGLSATVQPLRRQTYTLNGWNGAGSDQRSLKVAARGLDLLAGNAGAGNLDGLGSAARFRAPIGVAVDGAGNAYVADYTSHTIRKITPAGQVSTFAGSAGTAGAADGLGSVARFNSPLNVALDDAGNVYVADTYNHAIRKITPAGMVSTLAGTAGVVGSSDGTGPAALFNTPCGVAVDAAKNVYVGDSGNRTIRKITSAGLVSTLAGTAGVQGSTDGVGPAAQFSTPFGLAVDASGGLYVADGYNHTIRKITSTAEVSTMAGLAGIPGDADGVGAAAQFRVPTFVALDTAGHVYVSDRDNYTIRKITPQGMVSTLAGAPGNPGLVDGMGSVARFGFPNGIAVDDSGNAYVADQSSCTIRKINPAGLVSTLAGTAAVSGSADGTGSAASFNGPLGVAVDASGDAYVADSSNGTIRKVTSGGVVDTLAGAAGVFGSADGMGPAAQFSGPTGVAVDAWGNAYVADSNNHTIRKITSLGVVSTLAGTAGAQGSADGVGAAAQFFVPRGVAVDNAGNVYVAEWFNGTIRKITPGGVVSTLAGTAGLWGWADGAGPAARFNCPVGVAVDAAGNVYVADPANHNIRKVTTAGVVSTLAGTAWASGSADGVGLVAQFNSPEGLAVDASGNVYVADTGNCLIRKITPAGVVSTVAGMPGADGFRPGGLPGFLAQPRAVAITPDGDLIVSCQNGLVQITAPQ